MILVIKKNLNFRDSFFEIDFIILGIYNKNNCRGVVWI